MLRSLRLARSKDVPLMRPRTDPTRFDRFFFADRLARRRSFALAVLVVLLLMAATLVVTYRQEDRPGARLVVRGTGVERALGAEQRTAVSTNPVAVGEIIRTDQASRAQLDYFDGSVTLVDSETILKVIDLLDRPDRRTIAAKLDDGRIWNHVAAVGRRQDRFEVRIPNAWVTARGASNIIDCHPALECTVIGLNGTTHVTVDGGEVVALTFGECTTIDAGGERVECLVPREQLCADKFIAVALAAEGLTARCLDETLAPSAPVTSTPAPMREPTPDQSPRPHL